MGADITLANNGVATDGSGPRSGPPGAGDAVVVGAADVSGAGSVDGEHPASSVMAPKTAAAVWIRK
jgi:hypothetical protein